MAITLTEREHLSQAVQVSQHQVVNLLSLPQPQMHSRLEVDFCSFSTRVSLLLGDKQTISWMTSVDRE